MPHSGVGGLIPSPRKLSAEPVMIAAAMPSVASTISGASTFGRMCRTMIAPSRQPTVRAATTNSRSFTLSTVPRVIRT